MTTLADALAPVKAALPDEAKDLRLNLGSVVERTALSTEAVGLRMQAYANYAGIGQERPGRAH